MDSRQRTRHEISRDVRCTATGFAHELVKAAVASLERSALGDSDPDVARLFDEVDALVHRFRSHHRELSNARVLRRGTRLARAPEPGLPEAAQPFSYVGAYFGAYSDFDAFARGALGFTGNLHPRTDMTAIGLDMHLQRHFWTVERQGTLYAFRLDDDEGGEADTERQAEHVRRMLRARFGDDGVAEAMPIYAGRFRSITEFVRNFLWKLPFPTWLLIHVDVTTLGYEWSVDRSIFTLSAGEGGMHVFVRRDPLSHWRYRLPV
ncbi:hypothetical protein [Nannocystis pusilla]|uniref:Uncharacterized protein n=1 Tax=Nannocystis pusilla TaxID=889268 RepID=A0ABS7TLT1_9BACT|nr:hypothetical protein [Nannocystis pusilla]MBZ5709173.1 hypothetical protein [Nannocystis pusilla]